jgi:hypothetical protein
MRWLPKPALALLLLALAAGCGRREPLAVAELVARAQKYDRTIVTVSGCYLKKGEHALLHPCDEPPSADNILWVDHAGPIRDLEVITGRSQRVTEPVPARADDKARLQRLLARPEDAATRVTVQGEFQAQAGGTVVARTYPRRFIVDRVLEMAE